MSVVSLPDSNRNARAAQLYDFGRFEIRECRTGALDQEGNSAAAIVRIR